MRNNFISALFFILTSSLAQANIPDSVEVVVPTSQIPLIVEEALETQSSFEVFASSVNYLKFDVPTWAPTKATFQASKPLLGVQYVTAKNKNSFLLGFGVASFERNVPISTSTPVINETQVSYVGRMRLGYRRDLWKMVYGGITAVPTAVMTNETPVGRAQNTFTFPYQIAVGATYSYFAVEAFYENFEDAGLSAGVRIPL